MVRRRSHRKVLPLRVRAPLLAVLAIASLTPAAALAAPAPGVIPDDDLYAQQTALQPDARLGAPEAWKVATGAGVVVAVLDTGVDAAHPDLRGALWTNPGEIAGNGRDDDGNGHVDDVNGVDLVNGDGDPADDEGHGTHVAGIIAARLDGKGMVGLAPGATIMAIKVLDDRRTGDARTVAAGIRYALANGADVINVSVNGDLPSPSLRAAVAEAAVAGVTVVASAGNGGQDLGLIPSYPASYSESSILSVAATDGDGPLAAFSNFGRSVAVTAPGVRILSTGRGGEYQLRTGTSMAAPAVAAALALLHDARPDLSDGVLRDALLATSRRTGLLTGLVGYGALDVAAALHRVVPDAQWPTVADPPVIVPRVKRRGTTAAGVRRTLVTWRITGDPSAIGGYRVTGPNGKVLVRRRVGNARGAWVPLRWGRITVTALDAEGAPLARARLRLR